MDKQQAKSRFFGMHINCKVECKHLLLVDPVLRGVEINPSGIFLQLVDRKVDAVSFHRVLSNDCKLILRPLSSITLPECRNYVNSIAPGANDIEESATILYSGMRDKNRITATTHCGFVDYVRSINICVLFMGLDPIAEGWAILEEKLPANAPQETP